MKTITFLLIAICAAFMANSQELAFSNVSLQNIHNRETIAFSLPREVNVRHYRIEASNDSVNFEVVTTIPSKGNTVFPTEYFVDLTVNHYSYYRIGKVEMGGGLKYSAIVAEKKQIQENNQQLAMPAGFRNELSVK